MIVGVGILIGLVLGTREGLGDIRPGLYLPRILPLGFPEGADFTFALLALVVPQMPMTIGNAVIADMDLSITYFGDAARRVTGKALCVSMALGNFISALLGGMPICHGAGGLAAHYRFGARSPGSNLIIGAIFILLTLALGNRILAIFNLIPMAILGVLLLFAGSQLALTVLDVKERKGDVRGGKHPGRHPRIQPGSRVHGRSPSGLPDEIAKTHHIILRHTKQDDTAHPCLQIPLNLST